MNKYHTFLATFTLLTFTAPVLAEMYRWVDDQGKVHYSDVVEDKALRYQRDVLSSGNRVKETIQAAKTREELQAEIYRNQLRQEQEKIIQKQKDDDQVLIQTFTGQRDVNSILNARLKEVNELRSTAERDRETLKHLELNLYRDAAKEEKSGQKRSKALNDSILDVEQKLAKNLQEIEGIAKKSENIRNKFNDDVERYNSLTAANFDSQQTPIKINTHVIEDERIAELVGYSSCSSPANCDKAWQLAEQFIKTNSTLPIHFKNDSIIMTEDAPNNDVYGLSVSKMATENGQSHIFLDAHCYQTSKGKELCSSQKINSLRTQFRHFLRGDSK